MKVTQQAPNLHSSKFKRSKIVATVGPSTNSYEDILEVIKAGANGLRFNFSHGNNIERKKQVRWIRKASQDYGKPVAILQDLQGPKIRLGDFDGFIGVEKGTHLRFAYESNYEDSGIIPIQYDLSTKVHRGHTMYLCDGKVRVSVTSVKEGIIYATAENSGILLKRKGINLPDTDFGGDVITDKDKADLAFGSTQGFDYVAMSFIQTAEDAKQMRRLMKNLNFNAKLMAKIETKAAIANLEEIIQEVDAVMIARGDLAYEVSPEAVPTLQRQIITMCQMYGKISVVATQMLASMTESPEPTRAEVSDVATATLLQADALALSDETASGKYPLEAVKMMKRVINYTESHAPHGKFPHEEVELAFGTKVQQAMSRAIITLAKQVSATAIVAETKSGGTALSVASLRPDTPLIIVTSSPVVAQQLAILYGSKTFIRRDEKYQATKLTDWFRVNNVLRKGDIIVSASGKHPGKVGTTDTIKIRVLD